MVTEKSKVTQKKYHPGVLGKKLGMSQVFTSDGRAVPVTVIEAGPCYVLQVKTLENDGYTAVQLGYQPKKQQRMTKADVGHFAAAGKGGFYQVKEIRCDSANEIAAEVGKELVLAEIFSEGDFLDITGVTKGKGFQGVVRRFGVRGQPATRGTHEMRRHIGSIGCRKFPGRVMKNKKMPGHMGNLQVTTQNLKLVGFVPEKNLLLVKGNVPGARNAELVIKKARKRKKAE